ncbi:MAG: peptide deformylase [Gallionella sp.]|nr:peptide deformylase [Gallionella sp.]MCK9354422.1 peptide deformylase [Gallionella sp.]
MSVRAVLRMGDERLQQVAEPVRDFGGEELRELLRNMRDTMEALSGVGLAAPQIGVGLRVVIFGAPPDRNNGQNPRYPDAGAVPYTVLINPVVTPLGEQYEEGWEGCLSLPGLRGVVPRFLHVRYQGHDEYGALIDRTVSGFHARVVQHECDHLDGILYPMRMTDMSRFGYTAELFPGRETQEE